MLIGYARVSTDDQDAALQVDALEQAGCERIFVDRASGSIRERPELIHALEHLRNRQDVLVVWRLDRVGRSLRHLVELVGDLKERKIGFRSLNDPVDTTNASGRLVFHVFAALAEFERDLTRERTRAGLAAARARGHLGGRPRVMTPKLRRCDSRGGFTPRVKPPSNRSLRRWVLVLGASTEALR